MCTHFRNLADALGTMTNNWMCTHFRNIAGALEFLHCTETFLVWPEESESVRSFLMPNPTKSHNEEWPKSDINFVFFVALMFQYFYYKMRLTDPTCATRSIKKFTNYKNLGYKYHVVRIPALKDEVKCRKEHPGGNNF